MPGTDEDVLRDLMHRVTTDLHASPGAASAAVTRQRRRQWRTRAVSAGLTGVAAGTAAGLLATSGAGPATGGQPAAGGRPASSAPMVKLTAAQRAMYQLSSAAAQTPRPAGRYIALAEKDNDGGQLSRRTSVFDAKTGEGWTYQQGAGIPATLSPEPHASPTEAQLDALPTGIATLRGYLLSQARQQQAVVRKAQARQLAKLRRLPRSAWAKKVKAFSAGPPQSNDDLVFGQATDMLWNPMVGPALRAALYKVLATTPGVRVNTIARDATGRRAIELSRTDPASGWLTATFEDARNGSVLESLWAGPGNTAASRITAVYKPVTSSSTFPGDPYTK